MSENFSSGVWGLGFGEDMPPSLREKLNLAGSMHFRNSLFKESPH